MTMMLGRGLAPLSVLPRPRVCLDFVRADARPLLTVSRSTGATYFNAEGKLALAGANAGRLQHEFVTGRRLGLLIEHARVAYNLYSRPQSGTLANHFASTPAGLSVVTDASAPITSDFANHTQIWEFANTSGAAVNLEWNGAIGSTTYKCSAQLIYKITAGQSVQLSISGNGAKTLKSTAWARGIAADIQPGTTADKLRLSVPNNTSVRFFMANMQRDSSTIIDGIPSFATMPIDSAGATATRNTDVVTMPLSGFSETRGTIVFHGTLCTMQTNLQRGIFGVARASSPTVRHSILYTDDVDLSINQYDGTNSASAEFRSNLPLPQVIGMAYRYGAADSKVYESRKATAMTPLGAMPTGIDIMTFYRPDVSSAVPVMIVQRAEIYDKALDDLSLMRRSRNRQGTALRVIGAGQSNVAYQSSLYSGAGETAFEAQTAGLYLSDNTFTNGATGGTAAHKLADDGGGHWFDPATGATGGAYTTFLAACDVPGRANVNAVLWGQGEADAKAITAGTISKAQYKDAVLAIFERMRADLGPHVRVYIQMIGTTNVSDALISPVGLQAVRDTQLELISEYGWIRRAGSPIDLTRADNYHLNQAGYETIAARNAQVILAADGKRDITGTQGPSISAASYSGSAISISVAHDGGSSLSGAETGTWRVEDDGAEVAVSSVSYPNASTITLALAAGIAPGSTVKLWHGYGKMAAITPASVCRDNNGMPLRECSAMIVAQAS